MLGFPMQGWTLAIDLPLHSPHSSEVLKEIDRIVMEAGGRLYLTKDSRMNPEHLSIMYPRLAEWKEIKNNCDPNNSWQSDQGRRLRLC
jgi:decaprenylphospho-beta-D-ribofuranose 2-oxidase